MAVAVVAVWFHDVSGVVEAVGPGVRMYAPGDEVFGMPLFPKPPGAYDNFCSSNPATPACWRSWTSWGAGS